MYLRVLLSLTSIPTILFLLSTSFYVKGNTEIVNFAVTQIEYPQLTLPWTQITYQNRDIPLNITPILDPSQASPETGAWLILDLDDGNWSSYDKLTLRASWPASHPCDIYLRIVDPQEAASQFSQSPTGPFLRTRKKYAHVYAVNTGVPAPSPSGEDMTWLRREPVPITLILEPLHFGVLPQSVVPVVLTLIVAIAITLIAMPHVVRYYDSIAAPFKQGMLRGKLE